PEILVFSNKWLRFRNRETSYISFGNSPKLCQILPYCKLVPVSKKREISSKSVGDKHALLACNHGEAFFGRGEPVDDVIRHQSARQLTCGAQHILIFSSRLKHCPSGHKLEISACDPRSEIDVMGC